jgi:hypothetical protein
MPKHASKECFRVCESDFSHRLVHYHRPKRECHPSAL